MNEQNKIQKLIRDTSGAGMVEYIILVGLVALACITAYTTFGSDVAKKVEEQGGKVTGITAP
ncbi:MAG: Flp family type IVb pilin [Polyangiaceae bacterium]